MMIGAPGNENKLVGRCLDEEKVREICKNPQGEAASMPQSEWRNGSGIDAVVGVEK